MRNLDSLSLILMLNNDFEGGDGFTTPFYEEELKKELSGRLLVWQSNFMFP